MMKATTVAEVMSLCRQLDEIARDFYYTLADKPFENDLKLFWKEKAAEEEEHVAFWVRAEEMNVFSDLAYIFDDPLKTVLSLQEGISNAKDCFKLCQNNTPLNDAFLLALRIEYNLLNPAFESLFYLIGPTSGGANPEDQYDSHIGSFFSMMMEKNIVSPESELLIDALQSLLEENKRSAWRAVRDSLTKVLDRRGFFHVSLPFAYLAQQNRLPVAILAVEVDNLKAINDEEGHMVGDEVLKVVAQSLVEGVRASDIVGRFGEKQFLVFLTDVKQGSTLQIAENLQLKIEKNFDQNIFVSVSIGFTEAIFLSNFQETFDRLIWEAGVALGEAKADEKKGCVQYV